MSNCLSRVFRSPPLEGLTVIQEPTRTKIGIITHSGQEVKEDVID